MQLTLHEDKRALTSDVLLKKHVDIEETKWRVCARCLLPRPQLVRANLCERCDDVVQRFHAQKAIKE